MALTVRIGRQPIQVRIGENTAEAKRQAAIATEAAAAALETLDDVNAAGATQVAAVNTAGATQIAAATAQADRAEAAADVANALDLDASEPLLEVIDPIGQIVMRVEADGQLFLPGSEQSVQDQVDDAGLGQAGQSGDVFAVEDAEGNVTLRQKADGGLIVARLGNLQSALGVSLGDDPLPRRTARHFMHASVSPMILDLAAQKIAYVPPPPLLVPNGYSVPDGFIDAFTVAAPSPTPLDTPYASNDRTVHAYLIEMPSPFCGFRYLMSQNPYSESAHENPVIYGSNDLETFTMLPDMPQPLASPDVGGTHNFNSDASLTYDPVNGELICAWRHTVSEPGLDESTLWLRRTRDGQNWSAEEKYYEPADFLDKMLSPSLLYEPEGALWHMWCCRQQGYLTHYTATDILGPWSMVSDVQTSTAFGFSAWHLEVKFMGEKAVALVNQKETGANLFFGVSADLDSWTFGSEIISPAQAGTYKGTFLPEFDGDNLTMFLAWNTNVTGVAANDKRFFKARSNTVDLTTL